MFFLPLVSLPPSILTASFSTSLNAFIALFFGADAFFCFFALGGVFDRSEALCGSRSEAESSSSVSGLGRFFGAVLLEVDFNVACDIFFGAAFGAAAFFVAGLGAAALAFGLTF